MNYFRGIKTKAGATKRWKVLARQHHPDIGGDAAVMAEVNMQYRAIITALSMPPAPKAIARVVEEQEPPKQENTTVFAAAPDDELLASIETLGRAAAALLGELLVRGARKRMGR